MKREGLWEKLRLLNPKNLQREVHVYGYRFSWRTHLMAVIAALVGIGGIGMVFQLKPLFLAGVLLTVLFVFPVLVLDMYKKCMSRSVWRCMCLHGTAALCVSEDRKDRECIEGGARNFWGRTDPTLCGGSDCAYGVRASGRRAGRSA